MKKTRKWVFFVVLGFIFAISVLSFTGIHSQYGDVRQIWIKGAEDIRWGIDIRGGVDVTFSPEEGYTAAEHEMQGAEATIRMRLVSLNITDYEVYTDIAKNRIIVRFPWKEGETEFNPERAIQELGASALLTFREGIDVNEFGQPIGVTAETIILQGNRDVEKAEPAWQPNDFGTSDPVVVLTLTSEGSIKFAEATSRLIGDVISIWMDEDIISFPRVQTAITDGTAIITGMENIDAASDLANKINAGALPFKLVTENYSTISPTLGASARDAMALAGVIAFILMSIIMIIIYRLPGVIAMFGLAGQVSLIIASISGFFPVFPSFTLTLPGIAGIILSIGMGIDANVITAERIKEELHAGKTVDGAITAGYRRAFSAIFDGNITVIIVAAILMGSFGTPGSFFATILRPIFFMFGPSASGSIYSFGHTLMVGVIVNFIMGIGATRLMMKSLSKFNAFKNPWFYGAPKEGGFKYPSFRFIGILKRFITISGALFLATLIGLVIRQGVTLDIEFRGGSIITYAYEGELTDAEFSQRLSGIAGIPVSAQQSENIVTGQSTMVASLPAEQSMTAEEIARINTEVAYAFPANNIQIFSISNVDPTIGGEFLAKCLLAVALASILMIAYVAFRFRKIGGLSAGVMAVAALIHNIIIVFGVFVLFGIPLNLNFIAVLLTILGYSINDTIVIYDRIRENERTKGKTLELSGLVDFSINQSFKRTLMTTITTALAMVVVMVVAMLFGVTSIISFVFPLIVGLVAGAYSSICLAAPLWVKWQERKAAQQAA